MIFRRFISRGWVIAGVALLVFGMLTGWLFLPSRAVSRTSAPWTHEAYVWQRAWNRGVVDSATEWAPELNRLVFLAGEVRWNQLSPTLDRVDPDFPALTHLRTSVGIALRIGPYRGSWDRGAGTWMADQAVGLLRFWKESGVEVRELQLDFDAAESQLADYRGWVEQIRRAVQPTPVILTVLPSWLKQPAFRDLVRSSDGFVLQVHSVERPRGFDSPFTLCDPTQAVAQVERAARYGVPFRVALPTYGYLFAFDPKGPFLGLSAEGPQRDWPAGSRLREVRSDPVAMSQLVERWTKDRPELLRAILWYRLPVQGDRLNWRPVTLRAVMRGEPLFSRLKAIPVTVETNLFEIDLINEGTTTHLEPAQITMRWRGGRLVAADGMAGYSVGDGKLGELSFSPPSQEAFLEPGSRRRIGWFRLSQPAEVSLEISRPHP